MSLIGALPLTPKVRPNNARSPPSVNAASATPSAVCPDQQRECMLLRWAGLRYREIAQVLALNPSSVGVLVHRATARLSEELS